MFRAATLFTLAAGLAVGFVGYGLRAEEKKVTEDKKDIPKPSDEDMARAKQAQQVVGAYMLIEYGREQKAPEALITAARIIGTTPTLKGRESGDAGKLEPDDSVKEEAEKLLKEAETLAAETNPSLKESVDSLVKSTRALIAENKRGPVGGQRNFSRFFPAGDTGSANIDLVGGYTTVTARKIGGGRINVRVVGLLSGLEYANQSGWGVVSVGFSHFPVAKVRVIVTNEGSGAVIKTTVF
jgi:hypothetical protein